MTIRLSPELLSAYYDGELSPEQAAEVARQLEAETDGNQASVNVLDDYQTLSKLVQALPAEKAPVDFAAQVMQRIERESLLAPVSESQTQSPQLVEAETVTTRTHSAWQGMLAVAVTALSLLAMVQLLSWNSDERSPVEMAASPLESSNSENAVAFQDHDSNARSQNDSLMRGQHGGNSKPELFEQANSADIRKERPGKETNGEAILKSLDDSASGRLQLAQEPGKAGSSTTDAQENLSTPKTSEGRPTDLHREEIAKAEGQIAGKATLGLAYSTDLKHAEIGQVVEALETYRGKIAVVHLTVIDKQAGVQAVQMLLTRNQTNNKKTASQPATDKRNQGDVAETDFSDYEVVLVEATKQELTGTLKELKEEFPSQQLAYNHTVSVAELDRLVSIEELEKPEGGFGNFSFDESPQTRRARLLAKAKRPDKNEAEIEGKEEAAKPGSSSVAKADLIKNDRVKTGSAEPKDQAPVPAASPPKGVLERPVPPSPTAPLAQQESKSGSEKRANGFAEIDRRLNLEYRSQRIPLARTEANEKLVRKYLYADAKKLTKQLRLSEAKPALANQQPGEKSAPGSQPEISANRNTPDAEKTQQQFLQLQSVVHVLFVVEVRAPELPLKKAVPAPRPMPNVSPGKSKA